MPSNLPLWGDLAPGPYAVGFRMTFAYDQSRAYELVMPTESAPTPPKSPRPILINVWYPASQPPSAEPMRQGQYFKLNAGQDEDLEAFAQRLVSCTREAVCGSIIGKSESEFDDTEKAAFDAFCRRPTAAYKDADAAEGRFPLLIYHPGYGSPFVDNTVLFEYLASYGYVVVGSAYQSQDASILGIDHDLERSFGDMAFLLRYMQGHRQVDSAHVGVIGYSYGAQSALAWAAEAAPPVQAVISLDTTLEYGSLDDEETPIEGGIRVNISLRDVRTRFDKAEGLTTPFLILTQERMTTSFALYERLPHTERCYAQVRFVNHFHFASLDVVGGELRNEAAAQEGVGDPRQFRAAYSQVCQSVLSFLNGHLKADSEAHKQWRQDGAAPESGEAALITWQYRKADS